MSNRLRYLILSSDAFLFLFCLLGIYHVAEKAGIPATFAKQNGQIFVTAIKQHSPPDDLQISDIIQSVNGQTVSLPEDIEFLTDGLQIKDPVLIEIERNGIPRTVMIELQPFFGVQYVIIISIVGILFFGIGVFVLIKRPDDPAAYFFHWSTICVAIIIMATWGRYRIHPAGLGSVLRILFHTAYSFFPVLFVHFTFHFPRTKWRHTKKLLIPLYFLSVLFSLWMGTTFLLATFSSTFDWFHRFMTAFDTFRWFFSVCLLFSIFNLIHSYRFATEESERRKLRWAILGLAVGPLSYIVLWVIPMVLTSRGLVDEEYVL